MFVVKDSEFEKCGDIIVAAKYNVFAFTCGVCHDVFVEFNEFRTHVLKEHDVSLDFQESESMDDEEKADELDNGGSQRKIIELSNNEAPEANELEMQSDQNQDESANNDKPQMLLTPECNPNNNKVEETCTSVGETMKSCETSTKPITEAVPIEVNNFGFVEENGLKFQYDDNESSTSDLSPVEKIQNEDMGIKSTSDMKTTNSQKKKDHGKETKEKFKIVTTNSQLSTETEGAELSSKKDVSAAVDEKQNEKLSSQNKEYIANSKNITENVQMEAVKRQTFEEQQGSHSKTEHNTIVGSSEIGGCGNVDTNANIIGEDTPLNDLEKSEQKRCDEEKSSFGATKQISENSSCYEIPFNGGKESSGQQYTGAKNQKDRIIYLENSIKHQETLSNMGIDEDVSKNITIFYKKGGNQHKESSEETVEVLKVADTIVEKRHEEIVGNVETKETTKTDPFIAQDEKVMDEGLKEAKFGNSQTKGENVEETHLYEKEAKKINETTKENRSEGTEVTNDNISIKMQELNLVELSKKNYQDRKSSKLSELFKDLDFELDEDDEDIKIFESLMSRKDINEDQNIECHDESTGDKKNSINCNESNRSEVKFVEKVKKIFSQNEFVKKHAKNKLKNDSNQNKISFGISNKTQEKILDQRKELQKGNKSASKNLRFQSNKQTKSFESQKTSKNENRPKIDQLGTPVLKNKVVRIIDTPRPAQLVTRSMIPKKRKINNEEESPFGTNSRQSFSFVDLDSRSSTKIFKLENVEKRKVDKPTQRTIPSLDKLSTSLSQDIENLPTQPKASDASGDSTVKINLGRSTVLRKVPTTENNVSMVKNPRKANNTMEKKIRDMKELPSINKNNLIFSQNSKKQVVSQIQHLNPLVRIKRIKITQAKLDFKTKKTSKVREFTLPSPTAITLGPSCSKTSIKPCQSEKQTHKVDGDDIISDLLEQVIKENVNETISDESQSAESKLQRFNADYDANLLKKIGLSVIADPSNVTNLTLEETESQDELIKKFSDLLNNSGLTCKPPDKEPLPLNERFMKLNKSVNEILPDTASLQIHDLKRLIFLITHWYGNLMTRLFFDKKPIPDHIQKYVRFFHFIPKTVRRFYYCEYCSMWFTNENRMESHRESHYVSSNNMTCIHCNKIFKRYRALELHEEKCKFKGN